LERSVSSKCEDVRVVSGHYDCGVCCVGQIDCFLNGVRQSNRVIQGFESTRFVVAVVDSTTFRQNVYQAQVNIQYDQIKVLCKEEIDPILYCIELHSGHGCGCHL